MVDDNDNDNGVVVIVVVIVGGDVYLVLRPSVRPSVRSLPSSFFLSLARSHLKMLLPSSLLV
jgi:hypothetical protein